MVDSTSTQFAERDHAKCVAANKALAVLRPGWQRPTELLVAEPSFARLCSDRPPELTQILVNALSHPRRDVRKDAALALFKDHWRAPDKLQQARLFLAYGNLEAAVRLGPEAVALALEEKAGAFATCSDLFEMEEVLDANAYAEVKQRLKERALALIREGIQKSRDRWGADQAALLALLPKIGGADAAAVVAAEVDLIVGNRLAPDATGNLSWSLQRARALLEILPVLGGAEVSTAVAQALEHYSQSDSSAWDREWKRVLCWGGGNVLPELLPIVARIGDERSAAPLARLMQNVNWVWANAPFRPDFRAEEIMQTLEGVTEQFVQRIAVGDLRMLADCADASFYVAGYRSHVGWPSLSTKSGFDFARVRDLAKQELARRGEAPAT